MRWSIPFLLALSLLFGARAPEPGDPVFSTIEVWVETGRAPLAAWQVRIEAGERTAKIVGIEGGAHEAYAEPPFYDAAAMQRNVVVIASYSTASSNELPRGRTRVATLHVLAAPGTHWNATVEAAATTGARKIDAKVELQP